MKVKNNPCTMKALGAMGYTRRHICIIMDCSPPVYNVFRKSSESVEPTLKFMTEEQKTRMYVLQKFLQLKPVSPKWDSNEYYYVTILQFLRVPKDYLRTLYKSAPRAQLAQALRQKTPSFQKFNYAALGITLDEYRLFVAACYHVIGDFTEMR